MTYEEVREFAEKLSAVTGAPLDKCEENNMVAATMLRLNPCSALKLKELCAKTAMEPDFNYNMTELGITLMFGSVFLYAHCKVGVVSQPTATDVLAKLCNDETAEQAPE